eukprot:CAMPEP_0184323312 /NCGR_PEP_ID=MMETSP1049-20130417/129610_1 /TAXON_ID=77928 /ORGANISM="Proteomonas sulcata, Strain CCMP704" /LENGTH=156 /DNA_ID=CAMNT_0026644775 /DNA_START=156 /DNA_END=622 /DNA_ORIENTATION=+
MSPWGAQPGAEGEEPGGWWGSGGEGAQSLLQTLNPVSALTLIPQLPSTSPQSQSSHQPTSAPGHPVSTLAAPQLSNSSVPQTVSSSASRSGLMGTRSAAAQILGPSAPQRSGQSHTGTEGGELRTEDSASAQRRQAPANTKSSTTLASNKADLERG